MTKSTNDNNYNQLADVVGWLSRLAALCRHRGDEVMADQKIADLAVLLAADFAPNLFSTSSIAAVARGHEWFPPYEAIRLRLVEFAEASRPPRLSVAWCAPVVLPTPDPTMGPGMCAAERDAVLSHFRRQIQEMKAKASHDINLPVERNPLPDVTAKGDHLAAIRAARPTQLPPVTSAPA